MTVFPFKILTPEKKIYGGGAVSVTVTGQDGLLTVLAGHAPMLALLANGPVTIRTERETIVGISGRGLLRVGRDETAMLVRGFAWTAGEKEAPPADG